MAKNDNLKRVNESNIMHQAYADILGQLNETEARYLEAYARWKDKNDYLRDSGLNKPLVDRCFAEILNIGMNSIGRYGLNAYNVTTVIGYSIILMSQGADMKKLLSMKVADTFERPVARLLQRQRIRMENEPDNTRVARRYNSLQKLYDRILTNASETTAFYTPKGAALELTANEMHYFNAVRQPGITPADIERLKLENEQRRNSLYERLNESGVDLDELQKETIKIQRNLILQRPEWAERFQLFDYDPDSETLQFHNMDARFVGRTKVKKYYRYYDEEGNEVIHPNSPNNLRKVEINPIDDEGVIDKTASIEYEMSNVYDIPDEMMFDENGYIDANLIHWARPIYSEYDYNNIFKVFLRDNYDKLNDQTEDVTEITDHFQYLINCAVSDGISEDRIAQMSASIIEDLREGKTSTKSAETSNEATTETSEPTATDDFDFDDPSVMLGLDDEDAIVDNENVTVEDVVDESKLKQIGENSEVVDMSDIQPQVDQSEVQSNVDAEPIVDNVVSENTNNVAFGEVTVENVKDRVQNKILGKIEDDENFIQHLNMTPAAFRGKYSRFEHIEETHIKTNDALFDGVCRKYDELCYLRGYYPYEDRMKKHQSYTKENRENNINQIKACMTQNGMILSEMHRVIDDTNNWYDTIQAHIDNPVVSQDVAAMANEIHSEFGKGTAFADDLNYLEVNVLPEYHRGATMNEADVSKVYTFIDFVLERGEVLSPENKDRLFEEFIKQESEFVNRERIFEAEERKDHFIRKAHEDEINGIPRVKVEQTVEDIVKKDENNILSGKNALETVEVVGEDMVFDTIAEKTTSDEVKKVVETTIDKSFEDQQAITSEFAEEVIADGMDEAIGAGATVVAQSVKADLDSKVKPSKSAKREGEIRQQDQQFEQIKEEVKSTIKKSKGTRGRKSVDEALKDAERVGKAKINESKGLTK